jgi:hypothetical protein
MREGVVHLSEKEQRRAEPMWDVKKGRLTLAEAAEAMGVSYRQAKRIWARFRVAELTGLEHGLRGLAGNRRLSVEFRARVMGAVREHYADFGPTLAMEKLQEREGLKVSHETLRQWMMAEHLWVGRQKRGGHRQRRERRAGFGQMVQMDGSQHAWLEGRGPMCWLMVLVDDATNRTLVHFCREEDTRGVLTALGKWIERYGVPQSVYTDRKNVYGGGPDEEPTDFARACDRLGIKRIRAHSPQAKGRVERQNGTLQDRLVKELRLRGVATPEEAQTVADAVVAQLRCHEPASPLDFHRRRPRRADLAQILCFEEQRVVANDWTVQYESRRYQILRAPHIPRAGERVTMRRLLDGRLTVLHEGRPLKYSDVTGLFNKPVSYPPPSGGGRGGHRVPLGHTRITAAAG